MRQVAAVAFAVIASVALARAAEATAQDDLERLLKRGSTSPSVRDKYACACLDPAFTYAYAGVVRRYFTNGNFLMSCVVQSFAPDGSKVGESVCQRWTPVGR
jgi:hypothetical protein